MRKARLFAERIQGELREKMRLAPDEREEVGMQPALRRVLNASGVIARIKSGKGMFGQERKALVEVGEHIFLRKVGKLFIEQSAVAFQPAFIGGARARKYQISVRLVKKPQGGAQSFGIVFHDLFDAYVRKRQQKRQAHRFFCALNVTLLRECGENAVLLSRSHAYYKR